MRMDSTVSHSKQADKRGEDMRMDSTVSHDELSSKVKLAVLRVISTALAGKKKKKPNNPIPIPVFHPPELHTISALLPS